MQEGSASEVSVSPGDESVSLQALDGRNMGSRNGYG